MLEQKTTNGQATRAIEVVISDEAYEALQEIMEHRGISVADALKEALALEKWYLKTKKDGGHILVKPKYGEIQELVYP